MQKLMTFNSKKFCVDFGLKYKCLFLGRGCIIKTKLTGLGVDSG